MSELAQNEILSDEYINQVRTFGALNYTPERICQLLGLRKTKRIALLYRIAMPGDVYCEAYQQGLALGEYNIDAELAKETTTPLPYLRNVRMSVPKKTCV